MSVHEQGGESAFLETLGGASAAAVQAWEGWRKNFTTMNAEFRLSWRAAVEGKDIAALRQELALLDQKESEMMQDPYYDDDDGMDHRQKHNIGIGKSIVGEFMRRMEAVSNMTDLEEVRQTFWAAYNEAADAGKDPFGIAYVRALSERGSLLTVQAGIEHH